MAKGKYQKWLEPEGLTLLSGWARDGLTDEQIAYNMGVSRSTLNEWKKKYPDISDTLKKGKEIVDYEVENALLRNALSGNVTAQIYWLNNRRRKAWSNNPADDVQQTVEDDPITAALKEEAKHGTF